MTKLRRLLKRKRFYGTHEGWPIATAGLILICVVVFAIQVRISEDVWRGYTFVPANAFSEPWIFITSNFLHWSLDHLMLNLIGLAIFGYYVETVIGRKYVLSVFVLAGIASGFGSLLVISPSSHSAGASSGILGLLGFFAAVEPFYPTRWGPVLPIVLIYAIIQFIGLFNPQGQINHGAHLAGLATGIVLGALWRKFARKRE